jgi:hypothetical protein
MYHAVVMGMTGIITYKIADINVYRSIEQLVIPTKNAEDKQVTVAVSTACPTASSQDFRFP